MRTHVLREARVRSDHACLDLRNAPRRHPANRLFAGSPCDAEEGPRGPAGVARPCGKTAARPVVSTCGGSCSGRGRTWNGRKLRSCALGGRAPECGLCESIIMGAHAF